MSDFFATPDEDANELRSSDLHASLSERLGAQAADALDPSTWLSGTGIFRAARQGAAGGYMPHDYDGLLPAESAMRLQEIEERARAAIPDVSMADAKARVKQEGLEGHINLPSQDSMKAPVLDLMINEAHERRDREVALARGPQGFVPGALGLVTSLGAGMIDPVNAAAFSVPVIGEARAARMLASAGESVLARSGVRALQGGIQGAAGTAALAPADWWLHTRDGQDYTMADALKSVAMGAGMGAVAHAGFGGIGDIRARARGLALPGSPQDLLERGLMAGTHIRGVALESEGLTADEVTASVGQPLSEHGVVAALREGKLLKGLPGETHADLLQRHGIDLDDLQFPRDNVDLFVLPGGEVVNRNEMANRGLAESGEDLRDFGLRPTAEQMATPFERRSIPAHIHPVTVIDNLPPAAREDAMRAAAADVIADRPVRSAEMLQIAADHDPRIAESVDALQEPAAADIAKTEGKISGSLQAQAASHGERAARAADDPRWRELADAPSAYNEPQAVSESKAADAEPEPASVQPEKSLSAVEKAAADVEAAWRQSELSFSDEERQSVNEALDKIASDAKAREQIITEGAMCLAGRTIEEAA